MSSNTGHKPNDESRVSSATFDEQATVCSSAAAIPEEHVSEAETLPRLARRAVEFFLEQRRVPKPPEVSHASILSEPAGCFVSIKTVARELRGCIGTIEPARATLAQEIITNAISAATRDPRFPPVRAEELPHLRFSVDVLSTAEPARFEDLDPQIFGVIVEDETGRHRGLLLPAIDGIETPAQQVAIAARKAGLSPGAPLRLYRFRVRRFREQTPQFTQNSA